jgi:uncharacterized protein
MKFLIVIAVVVLVGWLILRGREKKVDAPRASAPVALPQAMVQCEHCGVHLPRGDALLDTRGAFCSDAHRLAGPRGR